MHMASELAALREALTGVQLARVQEQEAARTLGVRLANALTALEIIENEARTILPDIETIQEQAKKGQGNR